MKTDAAADFLDKQTARCVWVILDHFDREVRPAIPAELADRASRTVKRAVNDMAEALTSVLRILGEEGVHLNQLYLDRLDAIYAALYEDDDLDGELAVADH